MGSLLHDTKFAIRRGVYRLESAVDPIWWAIFALAALVVTVLMWRYMGIVLPFKITIIAIAVLFVLWVAVVLLGLDDTSPAANAAAMKHSECLGNMAEISRKNAEHQDHH